MLVCLFCKLLSYKICLFVMFVCLCCMHIGYNLCLFLCGIHPRDKLCSYALPYAAAKVSKNKKDVCMTCMCMYVCTFINTWIYISIHVYKSVCTHMPMCNSIQNSHSFAQRFWRQILAPNSGARFWRELGYLTVAAYACMQCVMCPCAHVCVMYTHIWMCVCVYIYTM